MAKPRTFNDLRRLWLDQLAHERRASPHTLRAYGDDAARFGDFLVDHLGGTVSEAALAKLRPADIRAFITRRRALLVWAVLTPCATASYSAVCPLATRF